MRYTFMYERLKWKEIPSLQWSFVPGFLLHPWLAVLDDVVVLVLDPVHQLIHVGLKVFFPLVHHPPSTMVLLLVVAPLAHHSAVALLFLLFDLAIDGHIAIPDS